MVNVNNNNIYITRGDSADIEISITESTGGGYIHYKMVTR